MSGWKYSIMGTALTVSAPVTRGNASRNGCDLPSLNMALKGTQGRGCQTQVQLSVHVCACGDWLWLNDAVSLGSFQYVLR